MCSLVEGVGVGEDGGEDGLPPGKQIAAEKELTRIVNELKNFGALSDYTKGDKKYERLLLLRARQKELRSLLGVVA